MQRTSRRVSFQSAQGYRLDARLDLPLGVEPVAYALLTHCFSCSKDLKALTQISRHLAHQGVGVLRFDFTGLGHSEGEFSNTNFSSNVADVLAAANYLREEFQAPSILIGHSFGGTAVLKAARSVPECQAVCVIAAPAEPSAILDVLRDDVETIERTGKANVMLAGREFTLERQFVEDVRAATLREDIENLGAALLVMHSPQDEVVSIQNAHKIYDTAQHPKSFLSLDGANHLLTGIKDAQYVAEMLAVWATRYVDYADRSDVKELPLDSPELVPDQVLVAETGEGRYVNRVLAGRHQFLVDEPLAVGGDDAGPDPYDLITAALGACTTMTLRMYAERKQWPLEHVEVRLNHAKIHAASEEFGQGKRGQKIDRITRDITVVGELDDAQRQRLLEIADRCPVHQTLTRTNVVESRLTEPDADE